MNREIEFRAWDKYKKKMYPVSEITYDIFKEEICNISLGLKDNTNISYTKYHNDEECDVSALILMQYTGLKDKNGKKIFEGDILKVPAWLYGEETTCVCIYNQENNVNPVIGFGLYRNNGNFTDYRDLVESDEWDEFEIIGNIYEETTND